jgi:quinol monooxygenase YgiN
MIHVLASIQVKAEAKRAFIELFKANVPNVLAEAGCLEYQPTIDAETDLPTQQCNPSLITVIEKWESLDHLKAHLEAPHMQTFREAATDYIENVELKILNNA